MRIRRARLEIENAIIAEPDIGMYDVVAVVRVGHGGEGQDDAIYNVDFNGSDTINRLIVRDVLQLNKTDITSTLNLGDDTKHDRILGDTAFRKTSGQRYHEPKQFYNNVPQLRLWVGPGTAELVLWILGIVFVE